MIEIGKLSDRHGTTREPRMSCNAGIMGMISSRNGLLVITGRSDRWLWVLNAHSSLQSSSQDPNIFLANASPALMMAVARSGVPASA